jgi:hypothetical protein
MNEQTKTMTQETQNREDFIMRLFQSRHFTGSAGGFIKEVLETMIAFSSCRLIGT